MLEFDILVKTPKGLEKVAASRIEELGGLRAHPRPHGLLGLVLVKCEGRSRDEAVELISKEVVEAEKVLPVHALAPAELDKIAEAAAEAARGRIRPEETFAVRTTRRGTHDFTSIDVNVRAGAAIQRSTGASVDLEVPDKIVWIEIIHDTAAICVTEGSVELKKLWPGKPYALPVLRKIAVIQMPYTGPLEAVRKMGVRIGRSIQTFEIKELVIGLREPIDGRTLQEFLAGLHEGIESRYEIQQRSYGRPVHKVPVLVDNIFQVVRDRRDEPLIATSTRGTPIVEVAGKLVEFFEKHDRVNILVGAREGLPTGIFRIADLVVDLAPGVTLPTDYAASSAIIAILTLLEERGALPKVERRRKK